MPTLAGFGRPEIAPRYFVPVGLVLVYPPERHIEKLPEALQARAVFPLACEVVEQWLTCNNGMSETVPSAITSGLAADLVELAISPVFCELVHPRPRQVLHANENCRG